MFLAAARRASRPKRLTALRLAAQAAQGASARDPIFLPRAPALALAPRRWRSGEAPPRAPAAGDLGGPTFTSGDGAPIATKQVGGGGKVRAARLKCASSLAMPPFFTPCGASREVLRDSAPFTSLLPSLGMGRQGGGVGRAAPPPKFSRRSHSHTKSAPAWSESLRPHPRRVLARRTRRWRLNTQSTAVMARGRRFRPGRPARRRRGTVGARLSRGVVSRCLALFRCFFACAAALQALTCAPFALSSLP